MFIVIVLGVIAVFAIAAILVDPREDNDTALDPLTNLPIWAYRGRR